MIDILLTFSGRVGIILNFFAGFLLAPELIGAERLKWLEDVTKSMLEDADENLSGPNAKRIRNALTDIEHTMGINDIESWLIVTAVIMMSMPFLLVGILLVTFCSNILTTYFTIVLLTTQRSFSGIKISLLYFMRMLFVAVLGLLALGLGKLFVDTDGEEDKESDELPPLDLIEELITSIFFVSFSMLFVATLPQIQQFIGFLVENFEERSLVRFLFVGTGIAFFILGNLLELLATLS
jgi:hypothetical protein